MFSRQCWLWRSFCLLVLIVALPGGDAPASAAASAPKRLALVISNSAYEHLSSLPNPVRDGALISKTLSLLGFEVTTAKDMKRLPLARAIRRFQDKLKRAGPNSVGLFYYAGHGMEAVVGDTAANYLIPVDAEIKNRADIPVTSLRVDELIRQISSAGNKLNIVIIDACRDDPFKGAFRSIFGGRRGLTLMGAPFGVFIASSTASGDVAYDGHGKNSPYTAALAKAMVVPGAKLEDVFKSVRRRVRAATKQRQIPWETTSLEEDFYFIPPQPKPSVVSQLLDLARSTASAGLLSSITRRFPDQPEAAVARSLLKNLQKKKEIVRNKEIAEALLAIGKQSQLPAAFQDVIRRFPNTEWSVKAEKGLERLAQISAQKKTTPGDQGKSVLQIDGWANERARKSYDIARKLGSREALDLVAKAYPNTPAGRAASAERDKLKRKGAVENDRQRKLRQRKLAQQLYLRAQRVNTWEAYNLVTEMHPKSKVAKLAIARMKKLSKLGKVATKSGTALVRAIQQELSEIQCLKGQVNGRFGRSTAVALRSFASRTDDKFYWHRASMAAYRALKRAGGSVLCVNEQSRSGNQARTCREFNGDKFCG